MYFFPIHHCGLAAILTCIVTEVSSKYYKNENTDKKYPSKNDRIAIIGAGPAGIHMTYLLQNLGYSDITIFEKEDRVGGKSLTYHHKGTRQEFGTVYTTVEYTELFKLLEEFGTGSNIPSGPINNWINPNKYFLREYPLYVAASEFGMTNPQQAQAYILYAIQKYIRIHKTLFSDYQGDLFPRPSPDVLEKTKGTFMEFLERNNITILKAFFDSTQTIQGYGHLDEISALYGLIWNTPGFVMSFLTARREDAIAGVVDTGFQPLWIEMVRKRNMKVIYNAGINCIKRSGKKITIKYVDSSKDILSTKKKYFDFLILAAPQKDQTKRVIRDSSAEEKRIFRKAKYTFFTTTLVDSDFGKRGEGPTNYLRNKLVPKTDHVVWATMDSYGVVNNISGPDYTRGVLPGNSRNEFIQSTIYYQHGKKYPSQWTLNSELAAYNNDFGIKNAKIIKREIWKYFPRYTPEDMTAGILWDILDMQGYKNTWYIGSSVCFESVKSVLEYNKLLLRKFNLM